MKVAVSIPDDVFREADRMSRQLRVPRSHLYTRALETFVRQRAGDEITARMNSALKKVGRRVDLGWENPGLEILRREKW